MLEREYFNTPPENAHRLTPDFILAALGSALGENPLTLLEASPETAKELRTILYYLSQSNAKTFVASCHVGELRSQQLSKYAEGMGLEPTPLNSFDITDLKVLTGYPTKELIPLINQEGALSFKDADNLGVNLLLVTLELDGFMSGPEKVSLYTLARQLHTVDWSQVKQPFQVVFIHGSWEQVKAMVNS